MMPPNVATARSPAIRTSTGRQAMLREHAAAGHVDRARDEVLAIAREPADADQRIRMEALAHAFPAPDVAGFAFEQDDLRDGGDVGRVQ